MAESAWFLLLLMGLRSHNTCNQGNKYMEIYRQYCALIYAMNRMKENEGRIYIYLNLKFHNYSSFYGF